MKKLLIFNNLYQNFDVIRFLNILEKKSNKDQPEDCLLLKCRTL